MNHKEKLKALAMNVLQKIEQEQIEKLTGGKQPVDFAPGDTVRVNVRIIEGNNERVQAFEGVCIARKNRGLGSTFTIRKISHGEGVERTFQLYSPRLESIQLVRRGDVRRAKLYYLRGLTGKKARIAEKRDFDKKGGAAAIARDVLGKDAVADQKDGSAAVESQVEETPVDNAEKSGE